MDAMTAKESGWRSATRRAEIRAPRRCPVRPCTSCGTAVEFGGRFRAKAADYRARWPWLRVVD